MPNRREERSLQIHTQILAGTLGFLGEPWEFGVQERAALFSPQGVKDARQEYVSIISWRRP